MHSTSQYPYPMNNHHPYPVSKDSQADMKQNFLSNLGTDVRITKGALRGISGTITGCTQDGFYFIRANPKEGPMEQRTLAPYGPFVRNEFEVLR